MTGVYRSGPDVRTGHAFMLTLTGDLRCRRCHIITHHPDAAGTCTGVAAALTTGDHP